jgi:hypothetical protein
MKQPASPAERLAKLMGDASEQAAGSTDLAEARRRFVEGSEHTRRPSRRRLYASLAATCSIAFALVVVLYMRRPKPISFVVGDPPVSQTVGDWVAAGESNIGVSFSDGSVLSLAPGARARVTGTSPDGAEILIERGTVGAVITHTSGRRDWSFLAGPFRIHVTGTAFDAKWNPNDEVLEVDMREGVVVVEGPLLPPNRTVAAGERLIVSVLDSRMELLAGTAAPAPSAQASAASTAAAAPSCPATTSPSVSTAAPPSTAMASATASAKPAETWRDLAQRGKHKEAMSLLSDDQFASLVDGSGAAELLTLADAARLGGRADRARSALLQARKRGARGQSGFLLGKISADQLGSPGDAIGWFEAYLSEDPNGPLAEQALGRILELEQHGSGDAARATARRYLDRFPGGAYGDLARSIAGDP